MGLSAGEYASGDQLVPSRISPVVPGALTAFGFCVALYSLAFTPGSEAPLVARLFTVLWLAVSLAFTFVVTRKSFVVGYLGGLLALLVGWRIAGLLGVSFLAWSLLPAFVAFVLQFADVVLTDGRRPGPLLSAAEWQLTAVRIYLGFDMVPHFTEKLFAGPGPFGEDVTAFAGFGLPIPAAFVVVGGLCELGIAVGLGMGFLTRIAVCGGSLYFLIATLIGGHFGSGFIWAAPGGGWEYPVLMMVLMMSYVVIGAGRFSVDHMLRTETWWPARLRPFASG